MSRFDRVFVVVIDSMGIGDGPDAADFGDSGADTLGHIAETVGTFLIPNLVSMGIADIKPLAGIRPSGRPLGYACRMTEKSNGKDTMTGHWEMMGVHTTKPFVTFTDTGFPPELIKLLEEKSGRRVVCNASSSGTVVLDQYAEDEIYNNKMIVYTSADSVLQICGNEETFGLQNLYDICEYAREITMRDEWRVGRIIARPYVGKHRGEFVRTFTNLVDFDALWGHRRNVQGYAQEIVRFDVKLGELLSEMKETDLLMITADHGNDPTYTGTDHTREQVPLLMYSPSMKEGGVLPETDSFAVIGCTIAENFGVEMPEGTIGYSILDKLV